MNDYKKEQDKATKRLWTHENDSIVNDPVTEKPIVGYRIFQNGYLIGEFYRMEAEDKNKILKAVNRDHAFEALLEALEACYIDTNTNEAMPDRILIAVENALKLAKGEA